MGTRGTVGFITLDPYMGGPVFRGAYNHSDSYPTGLGRDLQDEIKSLISDEPNAKKRWDFLLARFHELRWVDSNDAPTLEDWERYLPDEVTNPTQRVKIQQGDQTWYTLLRDDQGSWMKPLTKGVISDEGNYLTDGLFCEWGWAIDFTKKEFVILKGFNQDPSKQAPYAYSEADEHGYVGACEVWRGSMKEFIAIDLREFE